MIAKGCLIMLMAACMVGLLEAENSQIKFEKCPISVSVKSGQPVTLHCQLSRPVTCSWKRNTFIVKIVNRYKYIDGKNGLETTDCSIEIENYADKTDSSNWTCSFTVKDTEKESKDNETESNFCRVALINVANEVPGIDSEETTSTSGTTKIEEPSANGGISDKVLWISLAGGLVALSLLNTVIVVCYRRRAKSRRSTRNNSPLSTRHELPRPLLELPHPPLPPIFINRPASVQTSLRYDQRLSMDEEAGYLLANGQLKHNDLELIKNGQKMTAIEKNGHDYQNLITQDQQAIYEEIQLYEITERDIQ